MASQNSDPAGDVQPSKQFEPTRTSWRSREVGAGCPLSVPKYEMYAERNSERIECKKIVSRSQFNQGKAVVAEQTMREAIGMIVAQRGMQHPWVVEFMTILEIWLRYWGREDDANIIRKEIGERINND